MNIRPVRFPPWAAGARPTITSLRPGVAEARQRTLPVRFRAVRGRWVGRRGVAPGDEPRAEGAVRHLAADLLQASRGRSHGQKATVSVVPTTRRRAPRPTVVCFVRHGTTATTGKVLPGRARGLHLSDKGWDGGGKGRGGHCRRVRLRGVRIAARARERDGLGHLPACGQACRDRARAHRVRLRELDRRAAGPVAQAPRVAGGPALCPRAFASPAASRSSSLQARLADTVGRLCKAHPGEVVVAVSHADCIKVAIASALGMPLDLFQRIVVAPCSISTVVYGSEGPAVLAMGATVRCRRACLQLMRGRGD